MSKLFSPWLRSFLLCVFSGLFPLILLWNNNLGQISPPAVYPILHYTFVFILAVYALWLLVTRSLQKSALLSSITFLFGFSFGHLYNLVGLTTFLGVSVGILKLFIVWLLVFALLCFLVLRSRRLPDPVLFLVPIFAVFVLNLVPIVRFSVQVNQPAGQAASPSADFQDSQRELPDIYYIVLDAYARDDVLSEVIGYDNSSFLDALRERGFYIPGCAFSNYDGTVGTLQSVLNFDTLENLKVTVNAQDQYRAASVNLIHNNRASQVFRSYGYQFVTGRGYASFNDIRTSDVYLNYAVDQGIVDDLAAKRFASLYLNTTVFRVLAEIYKNNPEKFPNLPVWLVIDHEIDSSLLEAGFWYSQNNYMFDALERFPERPGSYFIYAHINAPHGPYVYRSDGSFRYPLDDQEEPVRYADAITYINKRVLAVVDALLEKSTPPPIIMIQGDHGIHKLTTGLDKHKILSAYYLPGNLTTPPYDTITPVNNFRLVLHNYFDPSVELLPDTLWVKFINQHEAVPASCDPQPAVQP